MHIKILDHWMDDHEDCVVVEYEGDQYELTWIGWQGMVKIGQAMEGNAESEEWFLKELDDAEPPTVPDKRQVLMEGGKNG